MASGMAAKFRIIDTGVREGRANIAFDAALIDARQSGDVPDTIRFLSFPPTALIGRHQDLSREIDLDYCDKHRVGTVRRITGGGAIYLDEGQLGWELVFNRSSLGIAALPDVAREICNAAAAGLQALGVDAKFRPRNDIEVDGRKISGTGGFYDGDVLIYKLAKRDLDSAAQRVVTLKELLGPDTPDLELIKIALIKGFQDVLGIDAEYGEITPGEERLARQFLDAEIGKDEFVAEIDDPAADQAFLAGSHTGAGGTIDSFVKLEGPSGQLLQRVLISGDFFVTPPRTIFDLEAKLAGCRLDELDDTIERFFAESEVDMLSVAPADFQASIADALSRDTADG
jgi:lipoate-protein ligase A